MMTTWIALALLTASTSAFVAFAATRTLQDNSWFAGLLPAALTALVVGSPLVGFVWVTAGALSHGAPPSISLIGQYFPVEDTINVGNLESAEYRVDIPDSVGAVNAQVAYTVARSGYSVELGTGTVAMFVDGTPVNAVKFGRRGQITFPDVGELSWSSPWWCLILVCDTRQITLRDKTGVVVTEDINQEIPIDEDGTLLPTPDGGPFEVLELFVFSFDGKPWLSGDLARGNTDNIQKHADATVGRIDFVAPGFRTSFNLDRDANENRTLVRRSNADVVTWPVPAGPQDTIQLLVYSGLPDSVASMSRLPLADLQIEAPSPAIGNYSGFLVVAGGLWEWRSSGENRELVGDEPVAIPGVNRVSAAGHLIALPIPPEEPRKARNVMVGVWLIGLLLLMATAGRACWDGVAVRCLILGGAYTLVMVRAIIALRAWIGSPGRPEGVMSTLIVLIGLPVLAVLLSRWRIYSSALGKPLVRTAPVRVSAIDWLVIICPSVSILLIAILIPDQVRFVGEGLGIVLGVGVLGMVSLDRMLRGPKDRQLQGKSDLLGFLGSSPSDRFPKAAMAKALAVIFAFGVFFVGLARFVDSSSVNRQFLGLATLWIIVGGVIVLSRDRYRLIRRRWHARPHVYAGIGAMIGAMAGLFIVQRLGSAWWVWVGAAGVALMFAWVGRFVGLGIESPIRIRSVTFRDFFEKRTVWILFGSALVLSIPSVAGGTRVFAGYALALGTMLAAARFLALFWHVYTGKLLDRARLDAPRTSDPIRRMSIVSIVVMTCAALSSFAIFAVADPGLMLLFLTATLGMVAVGFFTLGWARGLAGLGLLFAVALGFGWFMNVPDARLDQPLAEFSTAQTRFAAAMKPDALERHLAVADVSEAVGIAGALHHDWGIRDYAAGGTSGDGYLGTHVGTRSRGISWPIALSDNVFSVFVLSEHGWAGGTAVLIVYCFLALALLLGARIAIRSRETAPVAFVLVGLALFLIVPALYMAGANGSLLPLTGQNMPMLGIISRADAAFGTWVIGLGLLAVNGLGTSRSDTAYAANQPLRGPLTRLSRAITVLMIVLFLGTAGLARALWQPTHAVVEDFRLDGFVDAVKEMVDRRDIRVAGDSIEILPAAANDKPEFSDRGLMPRLVAQANEIARVGRPRTWRSCLDADPLFRIGLESTVSVMSNLCRLRAPRPRRPVWSGSLVAGINPTTATVTVDGNVYSLSEEMPGEIVHGRNECSGTGVVRRGSMLTIDCEGRGGGVTLRLSGGNLVMNSRGASIIEGGRPVDASVAVHEIRPRTTYEIVGSATFVVDIARDSQLTFSRWRNGEMERGTIPGQPPVIAELDELVARGMSAANRSRDHVYLSVRPDLQSALTSRLSDRCSPLRGNGLELCSVTVADPVTGDILALSSWEPTAVTPGYAPLDPNLRNHPVGSAIKPLMAAAALDAYPVLQTLEVDHATTEVTTVAGRRMSSPLQASRNRYPRQRVDWDGFLAPSNNLYAVTLGFLALASPDNGRPLLEPGSEGSRFWIEGEEFRGMRPRWPELARGGFALQNSPFATSLTKLFDISVGSASIGQYDESLFDEAVDSGILPETRGDLQRVAPEMVALSLDRRSDPRQLAGFFLGGDNRWNNVALTEAMARILTGEQVDLRLIRGSEREFFDADFADLNHSQLQPILDGMRDVILSDYGTARGLRPLVLDGMSLFGKTGTLNEADFVGSLFLFAVKPDAASSCPIVGVVYLRERVGTRAGLHAMDVFQRDVFPTLRGSLGWPSGTCPLNGTSRPGE